MGPQIEPEAGHWTYEGFRIRVVDIHDDHPTGNLIPPFNDNPMFLGTEIEELSELARPRDQDGQISGTFTDSKNVQRTTRPLSIYFSLRPPPITAQFNTFRWTVSCAQPEVNGMVRPIKNVIEPCEASDPLFKKGQELA